MVREYKHSYVKLLSLLYLIFTSTYLVGLPVYAVGFKGLEASDFYHRIDVWAPIIITWLVKGFVYALGGAYILQWSYKCKIMDGVLYGKNTPGIKVALPIGEIESISIYNIPLMSIAKIEHKGRFWSVWVVSSAVEGIKNEA